MTKRTLVICEKPTAAERIARALDERGRPKGYKEQGVPYFIAQRDGTNLVVVSALGHLFTITQKSGAWTYPVFDMKWVPAYEVEKSAARTRSFIYLIKKLSKGINNYVSACDYDLEGSLIAYTVLLHICGKDSLKHARRMRFSTLTYSDLVSSWETMSSTLDFPLVEAGLARHEVDWLFGINLSRALTLSVKNATGYFKALSIGRVQGSTLNLIKEREVSVRTFIPIPFWLIDAETEIDGKRFPIEYEKSKIETMLEAKKIETSCQGREGIIQSILPRRYSQPPPPPFNLGDLQREAYNQFKYTPKTTMKIAETLYLDALISYPRTSSQRLPPSIDLAQILKGLKKRRNYCKFAEKLLSKPKLIPRQGGKDDPAHPAIYPTGNLPRKLTKIQNRVYDLICKRFMAVLGDPFIWQRIKVDVNVNDFLFLLKGRKIIEQGWTFYYKPYYRWKEILLPALKKGQILSITRLEILKKFTGPPKRFNPSSLLKLMENRGIGTKATRTDILDTLFKRNYIEGNPIAISELGFIVIETLNRYCPKILSIEMTRNLEKSLDHIQNGDIQAEVVVDEAINSLKPTLKKFKLAEKFIGTEINKVLRKTQFKTEILGQCQVCGTGEIKLIKNPRTGKRFAGCSNYFNGSCDASYPLPQRGRIKTTGKSCNRCGAPLIRVNLRKNRQWEFCINLKCPSKRSRGKNE